MFQSGLLLGGFGIVFGLATWGYKIINRMGREITKISASRGFVVNYHCSNCYYSK